MSVFLFEPNEISDQKQQTLLYNQLIEALLVDSDDGESYDSAVPFGNIILDMDGTLGDAIPAYLPENPERYISIKPIPRPGLRKFLRFVFAHYERVSIWTAALPSWYNKFKDDVLTPNMPEGAKFHFERTRDPGVRYVGLKPLSEIYTKYTEYTAENTTIIDDNPLTFSANVENAVHVPQFFYDLLGGTPEVRKDLAVKDRGLFDLIEVLRARITQ